MKTAFQRDDAFLSNVRAAISSGQRKLWWLGQSGFLIVHRGRGIILDPYLSDSLTLKYAHTDKPHTRMTERVVDPTALGALGVIDAITSSHNHTDHLDAETLEPLLKLNPTAKLIIPAANRDFVIERLGSAATARLIELDDGISRSVAGVQFHGIAAAHSTVERDHLSRCKFLGYVIRLGNFTIYHSGDTMLHDQLVGSLQPFGVDLALLPINGDRPERRVAGNLDGRQAARLAHEIGARLVIPCHYDLFEFNTASPDEFVAECDRLGQDYHVLQNGEGAIF
jgi:L-ascorbate metabolism protein UlaG (beta-lactamase superfamily)